MTRLVLALISFYRRAISPALPPRCRFTPSCSDYTAQAITRFGLAKGSYLGLRRLLRCHPWHRGGHDPVPEIVAPSSGSTRRNSRVFRRHAVSGRVKSCVSSSQPAGVTVSRPAVAIPSRRAV